MDGRSTPIWEITSYPARLISHRSRRCWCTQVVARALTAPKRSANGQIMRRRPRLPMPLPTRSACACLSCPLPLSACIAPSILKEPTTEVMNDLELITITPEILRELEDAKAFERAHNVIL